jgi:hypothetical protein
MKNPEAAELAGLLEHPIGRTRADEWPIAVDQRFSM